MSIYLILIVSMLVQLCAAGYSLWHLKLTGFNLSWITLSLAFVLMSVRRMIPLFALIITPAYTVNYLSELIGLILSVLMLFSLFGITGLFQADKRIELANTRKNDELSAALRKLDSANENLTAAKDVLRSSSLYSRNLIETSLDPLVTISADGKITDVNIATEKITGRNRSSLVGSDFSDYFTEPEQARAGYRKAFELGAITNYPLAVRHVSGAVTQVLYNASVYRDEAGRVLGVFAAARDITERKEAEAKVQELLADKELILKEVHHRVKNNMNTIAALLTMQMDSHENPETVGILQDAVCRVQSMAVLYDKLYRSENPREIPIRDYLPALIGEITRIFPQKKSVAIETRLDDILLTAKILSPLGIIINELITNSMKYAFDGNSGGLITVTAVRKDTHIILTYSDNGKGLPDSVTLENATGFGMQLLKGLTDQLHGTLRLERGEGATFILEFEV